MERRNDGRKIGCRELPPGVVGNLRFPLDINLSWMSLLTYFKEAGYWIHEDIVRQALKEAGEE
jgi:hypothetical protein